MLIGSFFLGSPGSLLGSGRLLGLGLLLLDPRGYLPVLSNLCFPASFRILLGTPLFGFLQDLVLLLVPWAGLLVAIQSAGLPITSLTPGALLGGGLPVTSLVPGALRDGVCPLG